MKKSAFINGDIIILDRIFMGFNAHSAESCDVCGHIETYMRASAIAGLGVEHDSFDYKVRRIGDGIYKLLHRGSLCVAGGKPGIHFKDLQLAIVDDPVDGLMRVRTWEGGCLKDAGYGFYGNEGKREIICGWNMIKVPEMTVLSDKWFMELGEYSDGLARVRGYDERYAYMDMNGMIAFEGKTFWQESDFRNGYAVVFPDEADECVVMNTDGKDVAHLSVRRDMYKEIEVCSEFEKYGLMCGRLVYYNNGNFCIFAADGTFGSCWLRYEDLGWAYKVGAYAKPYMMCRGDEISYGNTTVWNYLDKGTRTLVYYEWFTENTLPPEDAARSYEKKKPGPLMVASTEIKDKAYKERLDITSLTLRKGVKKISDYAFFRCRSMKSARFPEGVENIGDYAFFQCWALDKIFLKSGLREIGDYAFAECSGAKEIALSEGLEKIGEHSFDGCSSFADITIPESVKEIGDYAFSSCSSLKHVRFMGSTPPKVSPHMFRASTELTTIYVPAGCVSAYRNARGWASFRNMIREMEES